MNLTPRDEHNQRLLQNVHPEDWTNPAPANPYNLVVVGGGTAGLVSAAGAAGLGARVALVERALMGGDCLNYGCVPSKGIIRCATALADVKHAGRYGIHVDGEVNVNFQEVMSRMRALRADISGNDSVQRFKDLGVDVFLGDASFTGPRSVEVNGTELRFSKAVIATGARASAPPIPGLEEAGYLTNESVFNLTEQPKSLAVIGAGPIGCEMAQTFQRLGTRVTLIDIADQILIKEDRDAAQAILEALQEDGVDVVLSVEGLEVTGDESGRVLGFKAKDGEGERRVDAILVAAGRKPNVEGMGLEPAGVDFDPRTGVAVNDQLKTSNPRIYAAGDVCSKYQFTHAADFLARTVITNALFPGRKKASALTIPWCTYTDPQIAHVGLTLREAHELHVEIQTFTQPMEDVDRAILDGETHGFCRVHVEHGTDKIVGATIVARHAGDMIGEYAMAMTQGIGLGSVANVIHPYPTQAESIRKTGDLYNRTRLTPKAKKIMGLWFKWTR